jgi:alpha-tubulin suppressor-like RCC1 family protein
VQIAIIMRAAFGAVKQMKKLGLGWLVSNRSALLRCAAAGIIGASAIAGCSATGDGGDIPVFEEPEEAGPGTVLPPPSNNPTDGSVPVPRDGGKDSSTKTDAGKDAGPPAPVPGTACKTLDVIASRTCGKCGKQEAICMSGDSGLVWSEYGPCEGEAGTCLPGTTLACGNCGTQTCTQFCGWGACTGQPVNSCSPGAIEHTTAGCPTTGTRSRTCSATCTWQSYSATCTGITAVDLWAGGPGANSTFMRASDGSLYAWGLDAKGQLGDSSTTNKASVVSVPIADVVSLAVGGGSTYGFACAAFAGGSAKCWGENSSSYGLGDGVTAISLTGVTPTGLEANVKTMVAGYAHGCGLLTDGTAKCWGYNTYGQLGNGNTTTSKTPVTVGLAGITQLFSGYYTACALVGDAGYCWGYNTYGQVGDGTTTSKSTPTLVLPSGVASFAPSYYHSCAVMTDGSAKCWGDNGNGSVGTGTTGANVTSPSTVVGVDGVGTLGGVAEVCAGYDHSCARLTDGRIACWGYNASGQLGIGSTAASSVPKAVSGITTATKLVCGYNHACAIEASGKVKCWGDNAYGQIGNGTLPTDATTPQVATF